MEAEVPKIKTLVLLGRVMENREDAPAGYGREYALASISKEVEEITYADYQKMVAEAQYWFFGPLGYSLVHMNAHALINQILYEGPTEPPAVRDLRDAGFVELLRRRR
ncbi:MAG TPA: hypothetical protein VHD55_03020 [Candidatus Paceibacterota bacterium]|nr:hypothetical protein [Candidatus Paceibacterota bacterium]